MKKCLIALTLGLAISGNTFADERTKQEQKNDFIGFTSGVVIGAAIAGPVGANA